MDRNAFTRRGVDVPQHATTVRENDGRHAGTLQVFSVVFEIGAIALVESSVGDVSEAKKRIADTLLDFEAFAQHRLEVRDAGLEIGVGHEAMEVGKWIWRQNGCNKNSARQLNVIGRLDDILILIDFSVAIVERP